MGWRLDADTATIFDGRKTRLIIKYEYGMFIYSVKGKTIHWDEGMTCYGGKELIEGDETRQSIVNQLNQLFEMQEFEEIWKYLK